VVTEEKEPQAMTTTIVNRQVDTEGDIKANTSTATTRAKITGTEPMNHPS
jgi:hypothetical protein